MNEVLKAGIDCYMSPGTKEAIGISHHRIHGMPVKEPFKIGTWTILPFDVQHDVSEPFGFLLANNAGDKLLFATDTYYIKYRFQGLTHLMLECNYCTDVLNQNVTSGRVHKSMKRRVMKSHFSLENVLDFYKANDLTNYMKFASFNSNSDEQLIEVNSKSNRKNDSHSMRKEFVE
jgi:phosphoribosyl 1,2-cyclic phosphodiesterase